MEEHNSQNPPCKGQDVRLNLDEAKVVHSIKTENTTPREQKLYSQDETPRAYGDGAAQASHSPAVPATERDQVPALDLNGFILYASSEPVSEELLRGSSGASIAPSSSVLDEENGRTYAVHETGKYFLPNDPVGLVSMAAQSGTQGTSLSDPTWRG